MLKQVVPLFSFCVSLVVAVRIKLHRGTDTSKVSQKDLDAAREKFHIQKDLQIEPKGYAFHQLTADVSGTFLSSSRRLTRWTGFTPDTDLSKFHKNFFLMDSPRDAWFCVRDKRISRRQC